MAGSLLESTRPDIAALPGGWEPETAPRLEQHPQVGVNSIPLGIEGIADGKVLVMKNALGLDDCDRLVEFMGGSPNFEQVSVQGRQDLPDDRIGSIRTTVWSPQLAAQIWSRIAGLIPSRTMNRHSATDWWQGDKDRVSWTPVAMSPLLRFMRYESGGEHYSHYDAGFIYQDDNYRTLQSVVIYLTDAEATGATRFIRDNQQQESIWNRNHLDWTRQARPDEVIYRSLPKRGKMIIFDHRLCHDVESYHEEGPRIIIRADIVFRSNVASPASGSVL